MTDRKFKSLIDGTSAKGAHFFTGNQLFAQWCRQAFVPRNYVFLGFFIAAIFMGILALSIKDLQFFWLGVVISVVIGFSLFVQKPVHIRRPKAETINPKMVL